MASPLVETSTRPDVAT